MQRYSTITIPVKVTSSVIFWLLFKVFKNKSNFNVHHRNAIKMEIHIFARTSISVLCTSPLLLHGFDYLEAEFPEDTQLDWQIQMLKTTTATCLIHRYFEGSFTHRLSHARKICLMRAWSLSCMAHARASGNFLNLR